MLMNDFLVAVGLLLILEGCFYAFMTEPMKYLIRRGLDLPDSIMRMGGGVAVITGVILIWFIRN
ncbi:MAG: DUF2065 family protein [Parvularculales bacterium]